MPASQKPAWKFWYPMPWWKMILIMLAFSLVANIVVVALPVSLGLSRIPLALGGGAFTIHRARKLRESIAAPQHLPPTKPAARR